MSGSALFVSLDQGGHSSRAIAFDERGRVVASAKREVSEERPAPGHVEQDPEALVLSLRESLDELCTTLGTDAQRIASIGLATQRSSLVCWSSKDGRALSPVLSWQDRRAAKWLAQFEPQAARIRELTGLFLSPHYGVSKMAWCLEQFDQVRAAQVAGTLRIGPLASFLAKRLLVDGGEFVDPCNAGRTLLFDVRAGDWSTELLALFGIPRDVLPECRATRSEFGEIAMSAGNKPLKIISGDQPAALSAHGAPEPDTIHVNLGTGAFVLRQLRELDHAPPRMLASVSYSDGEQVKLVVEGTVNGAASALDYAAGLLELGAWESELDRWLDSESEPPLFLNGVSGIGSPFWIPSLDSRWIGEGSRAALMVAVAESILFLVQRNLDELMSLEPRAQRLRVTGGLANSGALCQRLANLSSMPVERPVVREATARGTAFWLAGEPNDWPALGEPTVFEPSAAASLRNRYERWLIELDAAIS